MRGLKKYKSMIEKKRKKLDKIHLLAKTKLNTTKFLISKTLMDSFINHGEFFLKNIVFRKYYVMNE